MTDSVVRFSTYVGFSIFSFVVTHALYLACMIVFLNGMIVLSSNSLGHAIASKDFSRLRISYLKIVVV